MNATSGGGVGCCNNNNNASSTGGGSYFNGASGLSLSPRCRHQSSMTVSQQQQNPSWRKLQADYHSMRNIPQRYAPLHHHNHNHHHQMMPMNPQHQQSMTNPVGMMMEDYDGGSGYGTAGNGSQNGAWGMNGNGFSASVHDLPSSMNASSRLRRYIAAF